MVRNVFVSHVTSPPSMSAWAKAFSDALARRGFTVFEQRMDDSDLPVEIVERALRESDLIVMLMTTETLDAPEFFFEFGVAIWSSKQMFAVIPQDVDLRQLRIPSLREHSIRMSSPEPTADALVARIRERQAA